MKIRIEKTVIVSIGLLLLVIVVLLSNGAEKINTAIDTQWLSVISDENIAYLEKSKHDATELFVLLSVLESGVALVESSTAGISFIVDVQVRLGAIMHSLGKTLNIAWTASMVALSILVITEKLLVLSVFVKGFILNLTLILFATHLFLRVVKLNLNLGEVISFTLSVWLLLQIILPLSIYACVTVQSQLTTESSGQLKSHIEAEHQDLVFDMTDKDLHKRVKSTIEHYHALSDVEHSNNLKELATHTGHHVAALLIELMLLPLSLLLLGYLFVRHFFRALFHRKVFSRQDLAEAALSNIRKLEDLK